MTAITLPADNIMKSRIIPRPILVIALGLLGACSSNPTIPDQTAQRLSRLSGSPNLLCRYNKTASTDRGQTPRVWYFWRQPGRTETYDERSRQGEVWTLDPVGQVFYRRIFYDQRATLDYAPGDLAASGKKVSWDHLLSIVDPALLGTKLKRADREPHSPYQRYSGAVSEDATEDVLWLPRLRLPYRVTTTSHGGANTLNLLDCTQSLHATFRPASEDTLSGYRQLEFSDLGDMETDPLVQQVSLLMGGHHHTH